MSLTVKAYAKLNLWLDITGRREDGYHTINTVMRRIDLYDEVEVETCTGNEVNIECSFPNVPSDEWNIAFKAAKTFMTRMNKNVGVNIRIKKHIPVGAGLGGSSADGAAVLVALNELCGRPLGTESLCDIGARLGADVPFCITGGTACCTGIGDIIRPINCADFAALILVPPFPCSSAQAYKLYDETPVAEKAGFNAFCSGIVNDRSFLARNMYNVFERLYNDSRLKELKDKLLYAGARGACMSGSGSAVFGVFPDVESARAASRMIDCFTKFAVSAI